MTKRLILVAALIAAAMLSAACSGDTQQVASAPPTKTPKPTFTPTPDWTPTPEVFPTATALPATPTPDQPTAAPTEPPSPTPVQGPRLTANSNVNVRSGPGTNYGRIGTLNPGESHDITGKNGAGDWLQFSYNGQQAWVVANLVTVSGDSGAVQVAANIPAPPPPPPTARPQPTAPPAPTAVPAPQYPFLLVKGVERCDPNPGTTYVEGYVRYRNNSLRNGVCVHIAFYGPRNTKCSGCDGVGDGKFGFSPFGGPAPAGTTVEVFVVKCPPSMPMGGIGVDTAGGFGDLTPLSEKWVHTFSQSEQCTGITFAGD